MVKVDLHTHTQNSFDAITSKRDIERVFEGGSLDQLAITDHDEIDFALELVETFGPQKIIVGQEITTKGGAHMIGLFLKKYVSRGLSPLRTAQLIRNQGGVVYIPHPYAPKFGLGEEETLKLKKLKLIDIIEIHNSWLRWSPIAPKYNVELNKLALDFAMKYNLPMGVGSDAHASNNLGHSYLEVSEPLNRKNIISELQKSRKDDLYTTAYNKIRIPQIKAGYKMLVGNKIQSLFQRS